MSSLFLVPRRSRYVLYVLSPTEYLDLVYRLCGQYLEENLGANDVTLTEEEVAELRKLAETIHKEAPGERYPGDFNNLSFIDTPAL